MKNKRVLFLLSLFVDFFIAAGSVLTWLLLAKTVSFFSPLFFFSIIALPALVILSSYFFRIYVILWQFAKFTDFLRIFIAVGVAVSSFYVTINAVKEYGSTYSTLFYIFNFLMIVCLSILFRSFLRHLALKMEMHEKSRAENAYENIKGNVMIIGGGSAANMIISEFQNSSRLTKCHIKCVIDDDPAKKGQTIAGIKIVGGREAILDTVEKFDISTILFAIPSCSSEQKYEILNICQKTNCQLRIIPSIYQLLDGNSNELSSSIRQVEIEDLLGREPVDLQVDSVMDYVADRVILVTGGGGTIGSELCRQIATHQPKQLIIFDIYENNAYEIQNELKQKYPDLDLVTLIGSVRDSVRLNCVFEKYHPQIVYHAAAHKHVPLMEDSPNETIKNNVIGTLKTARCADRYGTEKFVLISTDKAVNPTNIMGASKRMCEMIVQTFNNRSKTEFVAVRFGNVLGSNGSVIPLFKKQIEAGGPVTVTDPNIIRYFMTIPEAVTLVLQAGATAKGGEIFVLDMGKPVKILTLAENLIKLSGLTPYRDIQIEFIGLRPGEKLFEEMLMAEEGLKETKNKLIHIGKPIEFDEEEFLKDLDRLYRNMYDESIDIRAIIQKIVPTYHYQVNTTTK